MWTFLSPRWTSQPWEDKRRGASPGEEKTERSSKPGPGAPDPGFGSLSPNLEINPASSTLFSAPPPPPRSSSSLLRTKHQQQPLCFTEIYDMKRFLEAGEAGWSWSRSWSPSPSHIMAFTFCLDVLLSNNLLQQ